MAMPNRSHGFDVVVEDVSDSPHCPHGPTLLFEKFSGTSEKGRKFFACSAFRDRKECSFFQWADEKISKEKQDVRNQRYRHMGKRGVQPEDAMKRLSQVRQLPPEDRVYCHTCGKLLLSAETGEHGDGHRVISPVTDEALKRPTKLFSPLDNNKSYAQYLFGESSVKFTIETVRRLGFTRVLCLGSPRIHEEIQIMRESPDKSLDSFLLDLDERFAQVWSADSFSRYNMFNHYFFGGIEAEEKFIKFVTEDSDNSGKLILVMDPPFGGMVEALAATVSKISKLVNKKSADWMCPVLWFFPYFMERRIQEVCPEFTMLDYKVDYVNHSLFHGGAKGRKEGSPVRIFTNLPASKIVLPKSEGYWFCKKCQRYSAAENWHCEKCGSCTSKDGKSYVHCDLCKRCVKPSRVHCEQCDRCELPDHRCGEVRSSGCHICGEIGHKRRECPNKHNLAKSMRKRASQEVSFGKKKKKRR